MLEVNESRITPQASPDFFSRHHRPSPVCEEDKHLEWLGLEFYEVASFPQFAGGSIQLEGAKAKVVRAWSKK